MAIQYQQGYNDKWVDVTDGEFVGCCDCGLIHKSDYIIIYDPVKGDRIMRRDIRHNWRTAHRRRMKDVKASIKALRG